MDNNVLKLIYLCIFSANLHKKKIKNKKVVKSFIELTKKTYNSDIYIPVTLDGNPTEILNDFIDKNNINNTSVRIYDKIYKITVFTKISGGVEPTIFGPPFWILIHDFAVQYDTEKIKYNDAKSFIFDIIDIYLVQFAQIITKLT